MTLATFSGDAMPRPFNLKSILKPVQKIVRRLKDRRDYLMAEVDEIDTHLTALGSKRGRRAKARVKGDGSGIEPTGTKRKGKRTRRSREELVQTAGEVVELIKGAGKEGATAKQIKAKFGNLLPSVNAWLKLYSPVKVKTTGAKSKMRYFA